MCGGIGFGYKKVPEEQLKQFFSQKELEKFKKDNLVTSFFWSKNPVLPIQEENGSIVLLPWGNRNINEKMPKTGWAKNESLQKHKWDYLKPVNSKILADKGYEKGVWFDIPNGFLKGITIKQQDQSLVYMVTQPASPEYFKLTGHDRQPVQI